MEVTLSSRPTLWRLARLDYDPVRKRPILLYPEGAVLLNESGAAILELLDGSRTVGDIVELLGQRYGADVGADVTEYLSDLARKELIRDV